MSQKPIEQTDCRKCGSPTTVIDSRPHVIGWAKTIKRRRQCTSCKARHTTYEVEEGIANDVFTDD